MRSRGSETLMKRRQWETPSKVLVTVALLGFGALAFSPPTVSASAGNGYDERPDVVIILTDDQRLGLLDAMPTVRRSIIDKGVDYRQAMVPTSVCCPSRTSILTGLYSHTSGVWHNGDKTAISGVPGGYNAFVANGNEQRTLAVALKSVGYYTGFLGKYLNGYHKEYGTPPGWDRWLAFDNQVDYFDYTLGGQSYGSAAKEYSTDVIARKAVNLIGAASTAEPLFLYIAPKAPHAPFIPAPRDATVNVGALVHKSDFGAFNEPDLSDKPSWLRPKNPVSATRMHTIARQQHRTLYAVDDLVGDVISALSQRGTLDNTLLIFMSDNGLQWGEHRLPKKDLPYSASTRIPMAMRWDNTIAAGTTRSDVVLNVDIAATVSAAAGADMPWVEGISLLSDNQRAGFPLEGTIGKRFDNGEVQRPAYCGWRTATRLFVRYDGGSEELYLLDQDPKEAHNVSANPKYESALTEMRNQSQQTCAPVPPMFSW